MRIQAGVKRRSRHRKEVTAMMGSAIASMMKRRMMLPALALLIVPLLVLLSPGSAAGRTAASGKWTVQPGQTLTLSHMTIFSANTVQVEVDVGGTESTLGTNNTQTSKAVLSVSDYTYTNDTTDALTVTLLLRDYTCTANYRSDGTSSGTTTSISHANAGYVKGKAWMAMAAGGAGSSTASCGSKDAAVTPALDGSADFTAMYALSRVPKH
jgi:hypothetical protein